MRAQEDLGRELQLREVEQVGLSHTVGRQCARMGAQVPGCQGAAFHHHSPGIQGASLSICPPTRRAALERRPLPVGQAPLVLCGQGCVLPKATSPQGVWADSPKGSLQVAGALGSQQGHCVAAGPPTVWLSPWHVWQCVAVRVGDSCCPSPPSERKELQKPEGPVSAAGPRPRPAGLCSGHSSLMRKKPRKA